MLEMAGFEEISVKTDSFGFYLQDAIALWAGNAKSAFGLQDVKWSTQQLEQCQQEYFIEIDKASTEKGYWNEITMFFVTARKGNGIRL